MSRLNASSRLLALLAVLGVWPAPPCKVDPQAPGPVSTPNIKDSIRLANILFRRPLGPWSVRRECRMLNSTEFERITDVINRAKRDTRIRPTVYDAFAFLHAHPDVNAGAHRGPGFLPFHRVLIFLFEKMLRLYDPTVSLCYWDSTLESLDTTMSASWTSALFGNNLGTVRTGFAAGWLTPLGPLIRDGGRVGRPFRQHDLQQILERETLGEISFPSGNIDSNLEEKHNFVHIFVGGLMGQVETASYDPIFWFHHTFIDCIYEWFRQRQLRRGLNPMRDWPADYGDPAHAPYAAMRLGSLRMIDGTNNFFSQQVVQCLDSAGTCSTGHDCGEHLRCHPTTRRCVSDTLAVSPDHLDQQQIHDLESLLFDPGSVMNSIRQFMRLPSRGFNHLLGTPDLLSFMSGGDSGLESGPSHDVGRSEAQEEHVVGQSGGPRRQLGPSLDPDQAGSNISVELGGSGHGRGQARDSGQTGGDPGVPRHGIGSSGNMIDPPGDLRLTTSTLGHAMNQLENRAGRTTGQTGFTIGHPEHTT